MTIVWVALGNFNGEQNMSRKITNRRLKLTHTATKTGKFISFYDGKKAINKLGAGDSYYIPKLFGNRDSAAIFRKLLFEVNFVQMFRLGKDTALPIPRMVSAQTCKNQNTSAIYRMPGCNQSNIRTENWTDTVKLVCEAAEKAIKQPLNHSVCTLFRDQDDSLAFHTDKLLDLEDGSIILSVSFGAARPIVFQEIDGRKNQTIVLQPGSVLAIGPNTNTRFKHAIPKLVDTTGPRISLSIRNTVSFMSKDTNTIQGKGAEHQTPNYPFIKSHDDVSQYSDTVMHKIDLHTQTATQRLLELQATYRL